VEQRVARLEGIEEQIRDRLNSIDGRFASLDARFDSVEARFNGLEARMDARFASIDAQFLTIDRKIDARFFWTLGVVFSTWMTTMLTLLLRH
jgi:predicted nuclease with TOPRIM domain